MIQYSYFYISMFNSNPWWLLSLGLESASLQKEKAHSGSLSVDVVYKCQSMLISFGTPLRRTWSSLSQRGSQLKSSSVAADGQGDISDLNVASPLDLSILRFTPLNQLAMIQLEMLAAKIVSSTIGEATCGSLSVVCLLWALEGASKSRQLNYRIIMKLWNFMKTKLLRDKNASYLTTCLFIKSVKFWGVKTFVLKLKKQQRQDMMRTKFNKIETMASSAVITVCFSSSWSCTFERVPKLTLISQRMLKVLKGCKVRCTIEGLGVR